jgi:hypothetical protein
MKGIKQFQDIMARRGSQSSSLIASSLSPDERAPRRVSNMSDVMDATASRRGTMADESMGVDDMSVSSSWVPKEVHFATFSSLHVYEVDESEKRKSYSSAERKKFQVKACREAARISSLIEDCPHEGAAAIRHLLNTGALITEELVGIENLINKKCGKWVMKERQAHSAHVLNKQHELQKARTSNLGNELAAAAISRSLKSVEKARSRAALAA